MNYKAAHIRKDIPVWLTLRAFMIGKRSFQLLHHRPAFLHLDRSFVTTLIPAFLLTSPL